MRTITTMGIARNGSSAQATERATTIVQLIADCQQRIATALDEAASIVNGQEAAMAQLTRELKSWVERGHVDAADVADALREHRVRTGDLESRFCDAMRSRGHEVFPHPYAAIERKWGLIEQQ